MSVAVDLIIRERSHQLSKGYNQEHDDSYEQQGVLAVAAAVYAAYPDNWLCGDESPVPRWVDPETICVDEEPEARIRDLVKAGALIVAEIERLQRVIRRAGS